jgi:flagellar hook protein FlgE
VNGVVGNTLGPLRVPVGTSMAPQATTTATLEKNLGGNSAALNSTITKTLTVYDPSGNPNTVTCTLEKLTANTWQVTASGTGVVPTPANVTLTFDANGTIAAPIPAYEIEVTGPTGAVANVTFDFTGLTNYTGDATIAADTDGYKMGTLQSTTIDSNGNLVGRFDNGQSQILGQVALATCDNPAGLTKVGSNLFMESNNSGKVTADKPGTGGRGTLNPGTLEMANVDLANEFSNMIITQRGFQANSKIITVTDEMLQELANLKR